MELFSSFFLILPLLLIFFFIINTSSRRHNSPETGFKSYPILGSLPDLLKNRHRFLDWTTEILAGCPTQTAVFRRPGKIHFVMTANPANVECMLKTRFENFPKGERFIAHLEDLLGSGIFNSDGEMWSKQRKTASYEFSTRSLREFVFSNATLEITSRLVPMLSEAAKMGKVLDFQDVLERFAFDNICKLAFNVDPACLGGDATSGAEFMRAFDTAALLISKRFMSLSPHGWMLKRKFNVGSERILKESVDTVHRFADDIVRARMEGKSGNKNEDLLSRFIKIDEMNSPDLLRDIVISFILAGRETTSSALSWFFWLLSLHPEVEEKIIEELNSIRARTGKRTGEIYSFEDLKQMNYLHASITESMRLYPPVHVDTLSCLKDIVLPDGTFVGGGWGISYNAYAMGRMESIWGKDCKRFYPERWISSNGVFRPENPFKFPVFHAGPRSCLGKQMAYIQMKSVAAAVLERFVIDVPRKEEHPEFLMSLTLRINGGLSVKVKERS
ncbi:PREDICTED: cytochrome P450 94B3 [Tarenaya hassleriana]|uniref:cytochrome P450 94B3 n=1 Tax=Tarenaya hassleriana TaxID=28532 RepID=UPI00053C31D4|nr:PREDICTED: cytochrome P450 94B3 [Tarenaya hassleriana]